MQDQSPRMEKHSALRRAARRQLADKLVNHNRRMQAAAEVRKAPRPPRQVQRASRLKQRAELAQAMAARREQVKKELGPAPIIIEEVAPKLQEAAGSLTAGAIPPPGDEQAGSTP